MPLKHGYTSGGKSSEYNCWVTMRQRCNNPNDKKYPIYGARGIRVCERWNSFENFLADLGARPTPGHSLDRFPDNNGNYEPGNVRWALMTQQANNRSTNRYVVADGVKMTISQAALFSGVDKRTIATRLNAGWTDEEALRPVVRQVRA